jgi:hypothetical protein
MNPSARRAILTVMRALLVTVWALSVAGCATHGADSEIPWNAPQSWEGSPSVPGLTPGY